MSITKADTWLVAQPCCIAAGVSPVTVIDSGEIQEQCSRQVKQNKSNMDHVQPLYGYI